MPKDDLVSERAVGLMAGFDEAVARVPAHCKEQALYCIFAQDTETLMFQCSALGKMIILTQPVHRDFYINRFPCLI